jgi:hypothetical protein
VSGPRRIVAHDGVGLGRRNGSLVWSPAVTRYSSLVTFGSTTATFLLPLSGSQVVARCWVVGGWKRVSRGTCVRKDKKRAKGGEKNLAEVVTM